MFSRILVGTDGSDTAATAIERATQIAQLTHAELVILHVYRTLSAVGDVGVVAAVADPRPILDEGREVLARAEQQVAGRVAVRTALRRGDPAQSLIDLAKEENADVIVVGNRGMRGARRMLGSVPNSVAHGARCDVLIVHTS
jgi:nucleotide-binding universal stress UspA family protein